VQHDKTYDHLRTAMQGFLHGWYGDCSKPLVIDKNRAWLHCIELLLHLDPTARILVPIRDLNQIYGSIEAQHQKSILVDFIDHLADYDRLGRADQLFAKDKSIGAPLSSIHAVMDLSQSVKDRLYFIRFEDLVSNPVTTISRIYAWLELSPHTIDT
jgi:sulfotransferase